MWILCTDLYLFVATACCHLSRSSLSKSSLNIFTSSRHTSITVGFTSSISAIPIRSVQVREGQVRSSSEWQSPIQNLLLSLTPYNQFFSLFLLHCISVGMICCSPTALAYILSIFIFATSILTNYIDCQWTLPSRPVLSLPIWRSSLSPFWSIYGTIFPLPSLTFPSAASFALCSSIISSMVFSLNTSTLTASP